MAFSCLRNSLRICWFGAAFVIVIPMTQESFPLKIPLVNFYIVGLADVGLRRDFVMQKRIKTFGIRFHGLKGERGMQAQALATEGSG